MKLNNFTSLDPEELARGIKGLSGASKLDRDVWNDLHRDWGKIATESEFLWNQIVEGVVTSPNVAGRDDYYPAVINVESQSPEWPGMTESKKLTSVRLAQGFYRRTVIAAYLGRCCISGNPIQELLVASHILPWADYPEHRVNPRNGLCLSRLHDAAFDRGLITFDEKYRLVLSKRIKDYLTSEAVRLNFGTFEGERLVLPEKFLPDNVFLLYHRERIFC